MKILEKKKLKYRTKDTCEQVFSKIKCKAEQYFAETGQDKFINNKLALKIGSLCVVSAVAYAFVLLSHNALQLLISYFVYGTSFLIIGINAGHDAAHHCFTGKKKTDNIIFHLIFAVQGLSGHFWQLRHNLSHHIYPNVNDHDTDMDLGK